MQKRKNLRLHQYNYSNEGLYFITICTQNRKCILSEIKYDKDKKVPNVVLLPNGKIAEKYIYSINSIYKDIRIEKYVIMPNHIHLICNILNNNNTNKMTKPNEKIPFIISTFKRLSNKEIGSKIWQRNYFERIIRNENAHLNILEYIENNPKKWYMDKLIN